MSFPTARQLSRHQSGCKAYQYVIKEEEETPKETKKESITTQPEEDFSYKPKSRETNKYDLGSLEDFTYERKTSKESDNNALFEGNDRKARCCVLIVVAVLVYFFLD